ncbi:GTPase HflX [Piscirickettsia salmonis]|uniref:GTPase HflX n=1 Tax=Piscirickettsia salmonis TaxID=1238 RepID=UPI00050A072F|nr:GTPase HflX [Piscirickettsia salmonis]WGZ70978.1 GTPase HflX [Piscirickettsia salmonis EM-90]APS45403.1 GTPase HflX [Piscirickettsia salmonis]APS48764.1 GTPase HflX [Piscirickettsia salmonis]APS50003.1 GTPase HflX [Piscirickettsia salmonis]APS53199.1 GTPase HflX [Piscirickettsia salmonis]
MAKLYSDQKVLLIYLTVRSLESTGPLTEFRELIVSAGREIVNEICLSRSDVHAASFLGQGQIERVKEEFINSNEGISEVIINHALTSVQVRNLSTLFSCRVLDRTDLILDIFAKRARTFEGKLQVELTQLQHQATRLVQKSGHYDQQRGGIGVRGGAGETGLEVDRRVLRQRIATLKKRLVHIRDSRALGRQRRQRSQQPTIALVGYTNAGKSTLFNALSDSSAYADDRLFATLDPTLRRAVIPGFGDIVLADTVGFIQQLPPQLIDAFRATLEETAQADLLLHVIDGASEDYLLRIEQVNEVLVEIGAEHIPQILVFNKVDLLDNLASSALKLDCQESWARVSAVKQLGFDVLYEKILYAIGGEAVDTVLRIPMNRAEVRTELHRLRTVLSERYDEDWAWIHVKGSYAVLNHALDRYGLSLIQCKQY